MSFEKIHQYFKEERVKWMCPLNRIEREFIEIPRSSYMREFRPLWLDNYQPPWFIDENCDERQILVNAGLMYRVGDYALMPSLLWLCQIDVSQLSSLSLSECLQETNGLRFNVWYGRTHTDFLSLPILAGSPDPTNFLIQSSITTSSVKPLCTFLDLDRHHIDHLKQVEQCVQQWLITVGHWSPSVSGKIHSFFHIPPPGSPKSTLHLHFVAGEELELEHNHVFYRVPLSTLDSGEQPRFIIDLTRWEIEQRHELVELTRSLSSMPRIYGIIGCTGSGKSILAQALSKTYNTALVQQDDFLLSDEQLPKLSENELAILPARWSQKKNIDRSRPEAVDWQKLIDHIRLLQYTTGKKFILVEGNLLLTQQVVREMLDRVLFIHVPESKKKLIMQRRMNRARPGCLSEVQIGTTEDEYLPFFNSVWNKYQIYGQPCFQAHHIDCEIQVDDVELQLSHWFINDIHSELDKCQINKTFDIK